MTHPEDLLRRLEEAERRLKQLEGQSAAQGEGDVDDEGDADEPSARNGWRPGKLFFVYDPEVAAAREQMQAAGDLPLPPEVPDVPGKPRSAAPKREKWYDKFSLRGYTQFRLNEVTHLDPDSAPPQYVGDGSIGRNQNFLIRRARLIYSGNVNEHLFIYFQPDFASSVSGSTQGTTFFTQIRDWYADVFLDTTQIHRLRVGQSKVPYGWENLQSSSNRIPLDRNDAFNSDVRNERDLGVFYYYTPVYAQKFFRYVLAENLKGSGNYGMFAFGVYNGQGGSFVEQNENVHLVSRFTLPVTLENGQMMEFGIQGVTGKYGVFSAPINPLGRLPSNGSISPGNTLDGSTTLMPRNRGILDDRLGWTYVLYPQPIGFQAEWTIGRGPALNAAQTLVEERALYGGYAMVLAKFDTSHSGIFYPFCRWQYFRGGYKSVQNAPYTYVDEVEMGVEWQISPAMELTTCYLVTDRTNVSPTTTTGVVPYQQFEGQVLRFQFQVNY